MRTPTGYENSAGLKGNGGVRSMANVGKADAQSVDARFIVVQT